MNCDTGTVLDVLDAAHAVELATPSWFRALAAAIDRGLGDGSGTIAMMADLSGASRARFEQVEAVNIGDWWRDQLALFEAMPVDVMRAFGAGPVFYFSQAASAIIRHDPQTAALLERSAQRKYGASQLEALRNARTGKQAGILIERLVLTALSPFGRGISAVVPQRSVARRSPTRAELAIWGRVAAHIAAAYQLRTAERPVEAVLAPGGKVLDATGPAREAGAREALRAAAISQDRVRSRRGRKDDARAAIEQWRAIVGGRWSLVDQFESDGRRFLVARVNERDVTRASSLSPREARVSELAALGHPSKLIAYELGLSVSTVARALASAARKLGVTSRVELIRELLRAQR